MFKKMGKDYVEEDSSKDNVKVTFHKVIQGTGVGQVSEPGDDMGFLMGKV